MKEELIRKINEVFKEILADRDGVRPIEIMTGDQLSLNAARLSGYLMTLSTLLGNACKQEALTDDREKNIRAEMYMKYRDNGDTAKDAESKARLDAQIAGEEYAKWHGETKELQNIKDATHAMIQVLNSRMADLRIELKNSNNQT